MCGYFLTLWLLLGFRIGKACQCREIILNHNRKHLEHRSVCVSTTVQFKTEFALHHDFFFFFFTCLFENES